MKGSVQSIFLVPEGGQPPESVDETVAIEGRGLEGDRYHSGRGTWSRPGRWSEVTLVAQETVEALSAKGFGASAGSLRRNLITRGVDLDALIGVRFSVGGAILEGERPCHPCAYLESKTLPGIREALTGCGGLRARVVKSGSIRSGDTIALEPEPAAGFQSEEGSSSLAPQP